MNKYILQTLIPEEWKSLLEETKKIYPNAFIAGGCLRDLDYEEEPKDIDIFIPSSEKTNFSSISKISKSLKSLKTVKSLILKDPEPIPEHYLESLSDDEIKEWEYEHNRQNRTYRKLAESNRRSLLKNKNRKIYHLRRGYISDSCSVDFIFGCKNTCDIKQFDFSFCQISYDGIEITKTPLYTETEETGLVKITNRKTFKIERLQKFKKKFDYLTFEEL